MKIKIYKLVSNVKQTLIAVALTVFSGAAFSQVTHTLNYTGGIQTLNLLAGTYSIECWGADGGNSSNSRAGIGGYSKGTLTLGSSTILYIVVGGTPLYTGLTGLQPGGYNGGGDGYANGTGRAGGGATHLATATGVLSALAGNQSAVLMVAAGGGGDQNSGLIGHGGGLTGGGTYPGTQTSSSGGVLGSFGEGGDITTSYGGGGGGGWYGGGGDQNNAGSGGSSYIGGAGITSATTSMFGTLGFVPNPTVTGNGMVIIKELCSISLTASGTNSLNPSICSGNSVTLTTNAASNYTWSNGNTTTTSIVVSPTSTQIYSVIGTSTANCVTAKSITVTVSSGLPVLSINTSTNNLCLGKTATVTASGALTYTWTGGVTNGVSFIPSGGNNTYTVSGQNGCGITTAVTTITVSQLPVTTLATPTLICYGSTATLTAVSAVTGYTWQPVVLSGANVIVSPTVNTIYTVTASDGTCSGTATVALAVNPIPTISIVSSASTVCEGALVTMTASGALSYTWTGGSTGANFSANPTGPTAYQVMGLNSFGCSSTSNQVVLTNSAPPVTISATRTLACVGSSVSLTANGANTYVWVNGPSSALNQINPMATEEYTVVGTITGNTCTTTKTILIAVIDPTVVISASSASICEGGSTILTASGANTYAWPGAGSGSMITVSPLSTSVYTVNANTTSLNVTCPTSKMITVTVFQTPTLMITATRSVICRGETGVKLTATGAVTYSWNSSTLTNTINVNPTSVANTFTVGGTDANGCYGEGSFQVKVNPCVGITEFAGKQAISVYPNPSNGEFMITSESTISLKIMNELGQQVRTVQLTAENDHKVNVNNLANGIYFVIGQNNDGKINQKIIVNK